METDLPQLKLKSQVPFFFFFFQVKQSAILQKTTENDNKSLFIRLYIIKLFYGTVADG